MPSAPAPSFQDTFGRVAGFLGSSFIVVVAILNALDWVTSIIGYSRGEVEANPITLLLTDRFGDYIGVTIEKIIIIAILVGVYHYSKRKWEVTSPILVTVVLGILMFAVIGYAVVVVDNLRLLGF
jgi:hypothetical protein